MSSHLIEAFKNSSIADKVCIWNNTVPNTQLEKFKHTINTKYGKNFKSYWDLHEWSINNNSNFWEELLIYFDCIFTGSYEEVMKKKNNLMDIQWFCGAKMNYAENLLRHRDNKIALIYNEDDVELVTYSQLYEQTKMYAAAFKKLGLKKGDRVACYISNRKEAILAMLASYSLGALWGGPSPFYGRNVASNIIKRMNPKFLFTVDSIFDNGKVVDKMENIAFIASNVTSLLKVIIVPRKCKTILDISEINNSCFVQEFLDSGENCDGTYDEISFLQLPFNHPTSINFTSGTTGEPKGIIHSAAALLTQLQQYGFYSNITEQDVILLRASVGWSVCNHHISNLALGAKIVLFEENMPNCLETYFWDFLAKFKVTFCNLPTRIVDNMEKSGYIPGPDCDLENLKMITIGTSPVKLANINFLRKCVKRDDVFIGIAYSTTEMIGNVNGFDMNMPAYNDHIQVPSLGFDIKCYDELGNSVVGQLGELVITSPIPNFPIGILNDKNNEILEELYFSKYNGVWMQRDGGWIDSETRGIVVKGRSDDVMKLHGIRVNYSDIYFAIYGMEELDDYICFGQNSLRTRNMRCVLFVKLKSGFTFSENFVKKIIKQIESEFTIYHCPEIIIETQEIPYNLNNKRMESLVKKIVATNSIPQETSVKNPECLRNFLNIPELQNY